MTIFDTPRGSKMTEIDTQLGNLLKKFRLNAKLSQKEISQNIISRSTYTRIECGETKISSTDLLKILDRLNLNYVEFFYLIEQDKTDKRLTLEESQQLGSNPNTTTQDLQNFHIKNMKKYKKTKDMFYYFSAIFAKVLLQDVTEQEITDSYNYLNNKEIFTFFDFSFLGNILVYMDSKRVYHLTNKMLPQLQNINPDLKAYQKLSLFFINLINLGLAHNDRDQTIKYIQSAKTHNANFPNYLMEIKLHYLENLTEFRFSNNTDSLEKCFTYINIFKTTGYEKLVTECMNDISLYIKFKNQVVPISEFTPTHTKHL